MSALLAPTSPAVATPAGPLKVTQRRVVRSEWIKFRSLRSTLYTLLVAVVLMIGIGALFSGVTASQYHTFSVADKATFSPISTSLTGISFAVIAFGVLGVLLMSGEYSTGMIRSSLTAVPRRLPVLWAKLAVFAGAIFATSLVASFLSFLVGQALLSGDHLSVAITAPGALRSVIGAALYVTVAGMMGVALGALLRSTAAGISTLVGVFFIIPPLTGLLPASVSDHLTKYLPSNAGEALWGGTHGVQSAMSPWTGFALLCGYAVIIIAAAAWRLRSTDA
jgi:ABC-type transport system involved in multi-copper enzyme maturation permease subunit